MDVSIVMSVVGLVVLVAAVVVNHPNSSVE
jgi:hypothetical protein